MEREIEEPDFGALRSLLHGEVSPARWRGLLWLVSGRGWDARPEEWLPYAQDVLDARWPDAMRVWLTQLRWSGKPKAANQLVRALHLTREARVADLLRFELEHLAMHAPPLTILGVKRVDLDAASAALIVEHIPPSVHTLALRLSASREPLLARALLAGRCDGIARLELREGVVEGVDAVRARLAAMAR
jgi:hypothetical protein